MVFYQEKGKGDGFGIVRRSKSVHLFWPGVPSVSRDLMHITILSKVANARNLPMPVSEGLNRSTPQHSFSLLLARRAEGDGQAATAATVCTRRRTDCILRMSTQRHERTPPAPPRPAAPGSATSSSSSSSSERSPFVDATRGIAFSDLKQALALLGMDKRRGGSAAGHDGGMENAMKLLGFATPARSRRATRVRSSGDGAPSGPGDLPGCATVPAEPRPPAPPKPRTPKCLKAQTLRAAALAPRARGTAEVSRSRRILRPSSRRSGGG